MAPNPNTRWRSTTRTRPRAGGAQPQYSWRSEKRIFTQDVSATKLRRALDSESAVRLLTLSTSFSVPATWGRTYARLAKTVPVCEGFRTVADAMNLMSKFLDPVLTGAVSNETWSHSSRRWH